MAKPFLVQNFSEFLFSFCSQLLGFCRADCHTASELCPILTTKQIQPILLLGASSPVSVHAICCMTSFLSLLPCFQGSWKLSTAWVEISALCYSALIFLTSKQVQECGPPVGYFFLLEHGRLMKTSLIQGKI